MFTVKDYCKCCKDDAYGGSIELVNAGIDALLNDIEAGEYQNAAELCDALEAYVDDILLVSTSVLPLINLLIKVLRFSRVHRSIQSAEEVKRAAADMLRNHKENQENSTANIGVYGSRMIKDGAKIGTFSTSGSVMAILKEAVKTGKELEAICFEARPHNEGYRTLREISELGISTVLGVDALICCLIPKCDIFLIGVDAITVDGSVYAKTGSYLAALACKEFNIPFYVAADTSKFDTMSLYGFPLKDSDRPANEVTEDIFPECAHIRNVSFELVPPQLIRGIITEKGIVSPGAIVSVTGMIDMDDYTIEKLAAWINTSRKC